jgi:hypothetical protein
MKHVSLLAGFLMAIPIFTAAPASAFCIRNQTDITLIARLETPNPLGGFHTMVKAKKTRIPPPVMVPPIEVPDLPPGSPPDTPTDQIIEQPKP